MRNLFLTIAILGSLVATAGVRRYVPRFGDNGWFGNPTSYTINAGDTVVLMAGDERTYFEMTGYRGDSLNPIIVINEGGQVHIDQISLVHCWFVKVRGIGDPSVTFGFKVDGYRNGATAGPGFNVSGRSKGCEFSYCQVWNKEYIVWAKQDPTCIDSLNYPNWTLRDIKILHLDGRNINQDAIYAGNTSPNGTFPNGGACGRKYPMHLNDFEIAYCTMDSVGRTGIQLGLCDSGRIHDNVIRNVGYENNWAQGDGQATGGRSRNVWSYNNQAIGTYKYGYMNFGRGKNYFINNLADSIGILKGPTFKPGTQDSVKLDSLATAWGAAHSQGQYFYTYVPRLIYSSGLNPQPFVFSPDWDFQHDSLGEPIDSSTIVWQNNTIGVSLASAGQRLQVYDYSTSNGKNPIGYFNYVCGNHDKAGVPITTVDVSGLSAHFPWSTDCTGIGAPGGILPPIRFKFTFPRTSRLVPRQRY